MRPLEQHVYNGNNNLPHDSYKCPRTVGIKYTSSSSSSMYVNKVSGMYSKVAWYYFACFITPDMSQETCST
jgi:hypothetical protein